MKRTQKEMIKNHLDHYGKITSLMAFELFGITRLAPIIQRLKKSGVEIKTDLVLKENRFGTPCRFAEYKIV